MFPYPHVTFTSYSLSVSHRTWVLLCLFSRVTLKVFYRYTKIFVCFIAIPIALICPGLACSEEMLVIRPALNKTECASTALQVGDDSVKLELCVQQGNFSHDRYILRFNEDTVLRGIDDQTTPGIHASYKGKSVALRCLPQNVPLNVTAAEIQKLVPSYSADNAKEVAELMVGSSLPIEIGRLCQVTIENEAVTKAQVLFE